MKWLDRLWGHSAPSMVDEREQDRLALDELHSSFDRVHRRTDRLERELRRVNAELRRQMLRR